MRGSDERAGSLFSYVGIEARAPADHPMRRIREPVNMALGGLERGVFGAVCAGGAALDRAGKAVVGQPVADTLSIRSQRQLMERMEFELLFRRFVVNGVRAVTPPGSTFRDVRPFVIADMLAVALLTVLPEIVPFILVLGV